MEHFVKLPPELCSLKIIGFSKDMGSSLSLLPSLMCRLENLLVAIELKDLMLSYFPEASQISASGVSHTYNFAMLMMKLLVFAIYARNNYDL